MTSVARADMEGSTARAISTLISTDANPIPAQ